MLNLRFLGGTGTVTGSKYLLENGKARILFDCGLFQGYKVLRLRNWAPAPVAPGKLAAVVLTHAHLDHSGYLPLLSKKGFRGPVFCTQATASLCGILLPDSGHLQEQDAKFANRHRFSRHHPALPLYTEQDAESCLKQFRPVRFNDAITLPGGARLTFVRAGHILGAASVIVEWEGRRIVFSGDKRPDEIDLADLHHKAHDACFIANSVKTEVEIAPLDAEFSGGARDGYRGHGGHARLPVGPKRRGA